MYANNKTVFQINVNNNKYILAFININYSVIHGGQVDVDKSVLLLFTATTGVAPFAKLFCSRFMIALTSLINWWCSWGPLVISNWSYNMYESMLSNVGFSWESGKLMCL